jgi:hypothetical protein
VQHKDPRHGFFYEECETETVSGNAITYLSRTPPPDGASICMSLQLDAHWPLLLHASVVRVDTPDEPKAPSRVVLRLGPMTATEREAIVHWVTREESREIAASHGVR